jgi:enterochelin esterase family protein
MRQVARLGVWGLAALWAGGAGLAWGQAPSSKQATKTALPKRAGGPAIVSPEVGADRRVTFRLRAPRADEVSVSGEWGGGPARMERGEDGVWSVTVGPVDPGLYGYSLTVDGLAMIDPGNPAIKPMRSPRTSILEVPGDPPSLSEFRRVPHGTARRHEYWSTSLEKLRSLVVYTPPDYDRDPTARFPVLFLFHGSGDNQETWTVFGRAHWIVDNLIAEGKAKPMVIVMPDGHAAPARPAGGAPTDRLRSVRAFERDLLEDVVPFVDQQYRLRPEASQRAIVGLSMGGGQSLTIGLNHADRFAWVGGFSSAVFAPETTLQSLLSDVPNANDQLRLVWIGCGESDFLFRNNQELVDLLKKREVRHEWHPTEGNHSWPVWRRYLAEFVPRLFVDAP